MSVAFAMALTTVTPLARLPWKLNLKITVASRIVISKFCELFLFRLYSVPHHVTDKEYTEAKQCDGEFGVVLFDDVLLSVGKVAEQCSYHCPDGGAEERA